MSLDNPDFRWVADVNTIEREDENGIRWRFESGRWVQVVQDPSIEPRRYIRAEHTPGGIRENSVPDNPEDLYISEDPIHRVLPNFNEDFIGRSSISNATIDGSRIVAGGIREAPPTPGIYTNIEGITIDNRIDRRSMEEFLKVWDYNPILHRKQNVYTKEEGGNWYFKSITSGKECGPYGTEEEAKKHERNINGK